ncbi:MAG: MBOAT family protein [Cyanobacteria bacterium]|nr:MBOAT family protein [Cyanobacteriota bacterium]
MLFNSINYLIFFPLVLAFYWLAPRKYGQVLLLIASYLFYMSWFPLYGLLIFGLTAFNYFLGRAIEGNPQHKKVILWCGIVFNLGALCYYKYADFLLESIKSALRFGNVTFSIPPAVPDFPAMHIILPLGISFFVFEFIHYIVDVYKGDKAIRQPVEFALFASFFPSQIAGPIKRFQDFVKQSQKPRQFDYALFDGGLFLLLKGLFKKIALADNFATIANAGFSSSASLGCLETWIAALAFTFQIYFDFSGYTDMGRGSAMMLGFTLPENFNLPYLASNLSDFWKRWHISLSSWLRDYLYIPLGGGRCSRVRKHFNLLATMTLGGLWHGAAWHFVIWGVIHGFGLVASHEYSGAAESISPLAAFHKSWLGRFLSAALTFVFVVITWLFFRAESVPQAVSMMGRMFSASGSSSSLAEVLAVSTLPYALVVYGVASLLLSPAVVTRVSMLLPLKNLLLSRWTLRYPAYVGVFLTAVALSAPHLSSFIYFQF